MLHPCLLLAVFPGGAFDEERRIASEGPQGCPASNQSGQNTMGRGTVQGTAGSIQDCVNKGQAGEQRQAI